MKRKEKNQDVKRTKLLDHFSCSYLFLLIVDVIAVFASDGDSGAGDDGDAPSVTLDWGVMPQAWGCHIR